MAETMTTSVTSRRSPVQSAMLLASLYAVTVVAVYWQTVLSTVSIWNRSDTYAHGVLIVPIVLWLIWRKRKEFSGYVPQPAYWALLFFIPGGMAWLLSYLTHVLVIQQLALVGIIIVGIWSILGHRLTRLLAFPLGFLILAVPMGEDLVPSMMEFTATSTVWLIELTGIPVYREGLYFTLPSGNWSVVEACSGVRYLIASFTLGVLYAHLTYRTLGKKLLFVLASIIVPVLANSARAFIIVMLGHISDMSIATGVDHLIYGWVFFGLVMLLLFWIGSLWRDDEEGVISSALNTPTGRMDEAAPILVPVFIIVVLLAVFWPLFAFAIDRSQDHSATVVTTAPAPAENWEFVPQRQWDWQPRVRGADAEILQFYRKEDSAVALYIQHYLRQEQSAELVSGKVNQFIDEKQAWRITSHGDTSANLGGDSLEIKWVSLSEGQRNLLLWYWYRIGDRYTSNRYIAKLYEAIQAITFGRRDAALVIVATETALGEHANERAREALQLFADDYHAAITASLDAGVSDRLK